MTKKQLKKKISKLKKANRQLEADLDTYIEASSRFLKDSQSKSHCIKALHNSSEVTAERIENITERIDHHMIALSKGIGWVRKDSEENNDNNIYVVKCLDTAYDFFEEETEALYDLKHDLDKKLKV